MTEDRTGDTHALWRARGEDVRVLSWLLHDGEFALGAGRHDAASGTFVLPMHRLDHARPEDQRYLVFTVRTLRLRRCTLRVSNVTSASVTWEDSWGDGRDERETGLEGAQGFMEIGRTDTGLVLVGLLGWIELACTGEPVVEVEDGARTGEVGMTQLGRTNEWEALSRELDRLRVRES